MAFIVIFIALVIERFFHWTQLRHWQWFARYQYYLNIRLGNKSNVILLAACILPPVILVALLQNLFSGWGYHIPALIFNLLILIYCLGPNNLWLQMYSSDQGTFSKSIFIDANQKVFGVIFWYILLGPAGAVLYRLINLCSVNGVFALSAIAALVQSLLDWMPVRLLAFLFALVGNFNAVMMCWKKHVRGGVESNEIILSECGLAALGVEKELSPLSEKSIEKEALALVDRAFIMMLAILATGVLII